MFERISFKTLPTTMAIAGTLSMGACEGTGGPVPKQPTAEIADADNVGVTTEVATELPKPAQCQASPAWVINPSPPSDVGNGNVDSQTNCEFYQFSWEWFLWLTSITDSKARFENDLRVFIPNKKNQCEPNPKTEGLALGQALSVRVPKSPDPSKPAVIPAELAQATGNPLYDQAGNVVLYTISYSDNECEATAQGYLPNTIELKLSWRQLSSDDPLLSTYYTIEGTDDAISSDAITLGLVGFHLVINTATHPEFIWATWEHDSNTPTCEKPASTPPGGWSFTSQACASCLATSSVAECDAGCNFNNTSKKCRNDGGTAKPCEITGTPSEVCQVFPDGTDPGPKTGGNDNDRNRENIDALNQQLVGPDGILTNLADDHPMAVWKHYKLVGGLWTDGGVGSNFPDAQRGSLELSNTTMETFIQKDGKNCFTCHVYKSENPLWVSHIIDDLGVPLAKQ